MNQNCFVVNVAGATRIPLDGGKYRYAYLFSTQEDKVTDETQAQKLYEMLVARFPAPMFQVSLDRIVCYGENVQVSCDDHGEA